MPDPFMERNPTDPVGEDEFWVNAERAYDGEARLNAELVPYWEEPGFAGWHISHIWDATDESLCVSADWETLSTMMEFSLSEVQAVRLNITYGSGCEHNPDQDHCRWQCERYGSGVELTGDVSFQWFFGYWDSAIWPDPDGEGCSVLFYDTHHFDTTNHD